MTIIQIFTPLKSFGWRMLFYFLWTVGYKLKVIKSLIFCSYFQMFWQIENVCFQKYRIEVFIL